MNGIRRNIHIRQQRYAISTQTTIFTGFQINATETICTYRNFGERICIIHFYDYRYPERVHLSQSLTEWDVSLIVDQNVKGRTEFYEARTDGIPAEHLASLAQVVTAATPPEGRDAIHRYYGRSEK